MNVKEKIFKILCLIGMCFVPLGIVTGCGITDSLRCENCGDNDTRLVFYAAGTTEEGLDYQSCVGCGGCLGFGLDSKCWPTECEYIHGEEGDTQISGWVYYYNNYGCIDESDIYSYGTYSYGQTCMGIECGGERYVESNTGDSKKAYVQTTCLGVACGSKENIESVDLSSQLERQFEKGCWSCSGKKKNDSHNSEKEK